MSKFSDQWFHSFIKMLDWPRDSFSLPKTQAHRGAWSKAEGVLENSLEAIESAKASGFPMVEVDIQLSRDGIPVVYHDETLDRLHAKALSIRGTDASELWEVARVPTLQMILELKPAPGLFNLELKTSRIEGEALERKVVEVIRRTHSADRIMFSSFNPASLWKVAQYLPHVPRAWIVSADEHPKNHWSLRNLSHGLYLPFHLFHFNHESLSQAFLTSIRAHGWKFGLWTLPGDTDVQRYFDLGASTLILDPTASDTGE